jgi:hypothetical protein
MEDRIGTWNIALIRNISATEAAPVAVVEAIEVAYTVPIDPVD